jgi:Type II restriction endonuclease EcoO109I
MARGHKGLPTTQPVTFSKQKLLRQLQAVDSCKKAKARVLKLETAFRKKIETHTASLLLGDASFRKFNKSPFVLLIHAAHRRYSMVGEIEADILPAKQFSSMETSAGRMVEEVALPVYGWDCVLSEMHSHNSALDGRLPGSNPLRVATLKSGPRCLNDEMSENFADAVLSHARVWATDAGVKALDFTYGVLYGTPRQSNKKDWHVLRNLKEKAPKLKGGKVILSPDDRWNCSIRVDGIEVAAAVRIGKDWWQHLGGENCLVEVMTALIRGCVAPAPAPTEKHQYTIGDLSDIVSIDDVNRDFNVGLLQRSQLPWLFLIASHFCDELEA